MAFQEGPLVSIKAPMTPSESGMTVRGTDSKLQSPPLQFPVQVHKPVVELHVPLGELHSFILVHMLLATEHELPSAALGAWQVRA